MTDRSTPIKKALSYWPPSRRLEKNFNLPVLAANRAGTDEVEVIFCAGKPHESRLNIAFGDRQL
jgi:hypothetical protein